MFGLGFGGSVIWIQRSMQEVADDREADQDEEPIPVVPMTEETENAMDNTVFQKLLKKLGVTPPANEQVRNSYTAFCETKIYVVLTFISAVRATICTISSKSTLISTIYPPYKILLHTLGIHHWIRRYLCVQDIDHW